MKTGIFGGTFDPPHIAHLVLASEATYQLGLQRLLWVLTPFPPHKQGRNILPLQTRLDLLSAALRLNPYHFAAAAALGHACVDQRQRVAAELEELRSTKINPREHPDFVRLQSDIMSDVEQAAEGDAGDPRSVTPPLLPGPPSGRSVRSCAQYSHPV